MTSSGGSGRPVPDGGAWRRAATGALWGLGAAVAIAVVERLAGGSHPITRSLAGPLSVTLTVFVVVVHTGGAAGRWTRGLPAVAAVCGALAVIDLGLYHWLSDLDLVRSVAMALWFAGVTAWCIRPRRRVCGDG